MGFNRKLKASQEDRESLLCGGRKLSNIVVFSYVEDEKVPNELGNLAKEIASQSFEGVSGFL